MLTMSDKLLNVKEAAEYLGVSTYTIRKYIGEGKIEGVRIGLFWRIRPEAIERYIVRNTKPEGK